MTFSYNPNIYISNLNKDAVQAAMSHAKAEFPDEACGAIIKGKYLPFENTVEDKANAFEISADAWFVHYTAGDVDCLVHSHNDFNKASVLDQVQQKELDIPSLIINLRQKSVIDCIVFGCEEIAPLFGRPFFYGAFDCISLVNDFVRQEFDIVLPNPAHDWEFWLHGESPLEDFLAQDNNKTVYEIPVTEARRGDILFYNMYGTRYYNHMAAVYEDNMTILHHLDGHISGKYPINYARKYLRKVMRLVR